MPDLVVSNPGERYLLSRMVSVPWSLSETWKLRLYKNDISPNKNTVLADLTEADYDGYLPQDLARDGWTAPVTIAGVAVCFYGFQPIEFFAASGLQTVFGYFMTVDADSDPELLILTQRFDSAVNVTAAVPALVLPQIRLHSESEP